MAPITIVRVGLVTAASSPYLHKVAPDRLVYKHTVRAIRLALLLLSTVRAKHQFALLGQHFDNVKNNARWFGGKIENVQPYVDDFLRQILCEFPIFAIDETMPDEHMAFHGRFRREGSSFLSTREEIHVNAKYILKMKEAAIKYDVDGFERYQFWLMCTLVHEMGHVFITYLSPGGEQTPSPIHHACVPGKGEAGAYLEGQLFGGYLVYVLEGGQGYENHLDGNVKIGVPYIALDDGSCVKQISPGMIRRYVWNGVITLPFQTMDPGISIDLLKEYGHVWGMDTYWGGSQQLAIVQDDQLVDEHQMLLPQAFDGFNIEQQ